MSKLIDLAVYTNPLSRTPGMLRAVVEGQPDAWLDARHASDVCSPREAVAHLVLCDRESWVLRVKRVLHPEIKIEVPPFAELEESEVLKTRSVGDLLDEFDELRPQRLRDLAELNLTEADLEKRGVHSQFGDYTVANLLATWVAHDLYHLGQIFKSYSAPYAEQIGPWQHYLNLPNFN
jgi:uncharacterized damage-inducible protein DinB